MWGLLGLGSLGSTVYSAIFRSSAGLGRVGVGFGLGLLVLGSLGSTVYAAIFKPLAGLGLGLGGFVLGLGWVCWGLGRLGSMVC